LDCASRLSVCCAQLHNLLGPSTQSDAQKRTFSNSNVKDDIAHQGKNFQIESILDAIGDNILLDN
jgi:hypothetical protein